MGNFATYAASLQHSNYKRLVTSLRLVLLRKLLTLKQVDIFNNQLLEVNFILT